MQPTLATSGALTLAALLTPHTAAAFGNLDCITTQVCTNTGCTSATTPMSVTFNRALETVGVIGESDDGLASILEYGKMDEVNRMLRIAASGAYISVTYIFKAPSVTTWTATCDVRRAA
jgi:hypothetical protein